MAFSIGVSIPSVRRWRVSFVATEWNTTLGCWARSFVPTGLSELGVGEEPSAKATGYLRRSPTASTATLGSIPF